jgi:hypothetical protein
VDSGLQEENRLVAEVLRTRLEDHATNEPLKELEASGTLGPAQKAP